MPRIKRRMTELASQANRANARRSANPRPTFSRFQRKAQVLQQMQSEEKTNGAAKMQIQKMSKMH